MTRDEIRGRLLSLRESDFTGAEKLAQDLARDARAPQRVFTRILAWPDYPHRTNAEAVLKGLHELALMPRLSASRKLTGAVRIQALLEAFRLYRTQEQKAAAALRPMLESRVPAPRPEIPGPVEVRVPIPRECDEAYLLVRRMNLPDEPDEQRLRFNSAFIRKPEAERDRAIRAYLETGDVQ